MQSFSLKPKGKREIKGEGVGRAGQREKEEREGERVRREKEKREREERVREKLNKKRRGDVASRLGWLTLEERERWRR